MNKFLFFPVFLLPLFASAQSIEQSKYEVITYIVDGDLLNFDYDFIYGRQEDEPVQVYGFAAQQDSVILYDLETFSEKSIAGTEYHASYRKQVKNEFKKEIAFWKRREKSGEKIILLEGMDKRALYYNSRYINKSEFPGYEKLVEGLIRSQSVRWDTKKIRSDRGVKILDLTPENVEAFRGQSTGFIQFSDVIVDETQTKSAVLMHWFCGDECGACYLLLLEKENGQWQYKQIQMLWES